MSLNVIDWLFVRIPIWQLGIGVFLLQFAAMEIGRRLKQYRAARAESGLAKLGKEDFVISAILGLLALLLGFTFSLALDRFDTRRTLVVEEANAIGTTYLRAQTFDEPHRSRLSRLLLHYVDNRLAAGSASDLPQMQQQLAITDALQTQLWAETVAAVGPKRDGISSAFLTSMNQTIDLAASRKAARIAHVPARVFATLLIYMAAAACSLGYIFADVRRIVGASLLLLITLAFQLIVDIDRPVSGTMKESQQPMQDLKVSLSAQPPAVFGSGLAKRPPAW